MANPLTTLRKLTSIPTKQTSCAPRRSWRSAHNPGDEDILERLLALNLERAGEEEGAS
jgi:hypothetical protein